MVPLLLVERLCLLTGKNDSQKGVAQGCSTEDRSVSSSRPLRLHVSSEEVAVFQYVGERMSIMGFSGARETPLLGLDFFFLCDRMLVYIC